MAGVRAERITKVYQQDHVAVEALTELMGQGYDGSVLSRKVGDEVVHFVQLGPYPSEDEASHAAREIGVATGATTRIVVQP